jgi:hypothetical protein
MNDSPPNPGEPRARPPVENEVPHYHDDDDLDLQADDSQSRHHRPAVPVKGPRKPPPRPSRFHDE